MTSATPPWRSRSARPGRAPEGHPGADGPQLRHGDPRRYGHLYEGLDGRIADGLDEMLRDSRGLAAAWASSAAPSGACGRTIAAGQGQWG